MPECAVRRWHACRFRAPDDCAGPAGPVQLSDHEEVAGHPAVHLGSIRCGVATGGAAVLVPDKKEVQLFERGMTSIRSWS